MNMIKHEKMQRRQALTDAQELLDEARDLQDEIRLKLKRIRELTGVELSALEDLDDVGDIEGMAGE